MNEFRVLNGKGDIEVKILKPANAVFQTDEFHVDSTVTVYKNAFNIFDLVFENQQLKERIEYLERSNNRREGTILEQRQEINDVKDNWNKLKKTIDIKLYNTEYLQKLWGYKIDDEIHIILDIIKKEMKELEAKK